MGKHNIAKGIAVVFSQDSLLYKFISVILLQEAIKGFLPIKLPS